MHLRCREQLNGRPFGPQILRFKLIEEDAPIVCWRHLKPINKCWNLRIWRQLLDIHSVTTSGFHRQNSKWKLKPEASSVYTIGGKTLVPQSLYEWSAQKSRRDRRSENECIWVVVTTWLSRDQKWRRGIVTTAIVTLQCLSPGDVDVEAQCDADAAVTWLVTSTSSMNSHRSVKVL